MEREIVFSKKSELQIDEIYQYVYNASNDKETAKKFVNELLNKTEILKKHAFVGRQLELIDNIVTQYRFIRYKDYLIFYRVDDKKVYIDRILSSKQDYVNEFTKELQVKSIIEKDLKASKNKLVDFDDGLFYALVDRVKVNKDNIKIIWKDGAES